MLQKPRIWKNQIDNSRLFDSFQVGWNYWIVFPTSNNLTIIMLLPFFLNRLEELFSPMLIARPRHGTVSFNWSSDGHRYRLPRTPINLSRKFKRRLHHFLAACEIRKSTIRNAGSGVFLLESVQEGQIMFKYGGRRISFPEAYRLSKMVRQLLCSIPSTNLRVYGSNKIYRDWIRTSKKTYRMRFAMTQGQTTTRRWNGSCGTILLEDFSTQM